MIQWNAVVWNCNSITAHSRLAQLQLLTSPHSSSRPLFIALTESKLDAAAPVPPLYGYTSFAAPGVVTDGGGLSGGLVLYVRSNIPCSLAADITGDGGASVLFVRIMVPGVGLALLGVCYRRPIPSSPCLGLILTATKRALATHMPVLLCGDLNAHHESWSRGVANPAGRQLRAYCDVHDVSVLNSLHCPLVSTLHAHESTVDLVLSSHPHLFASLTCEPALALSSDHVPLVLRGLASGGGAPRPPAVSYSRWDIEHADWSLFRRLLDEAGVATLASIHATLSSAIALPAVAMEQAWSLFVDFVLGCARLAVGVKRVSNRPRKHWCKAVPGVTAANVALQRATRQHARHRTPANLELRRQARQHLAAVVRAAKGKMWFDLCAKVSAAPSSKLMWAAFGRTTPHPTTPPSSVQLPGSPLPATEHAALNNLAAHFASCCSLFPATDASRERDEQMDEFWRHVDPAEADPVRDAPFTIGEVEAVCRKAKVNSAMGPDDFSPHFLAQGSSALFACLGALVDFSWANAVLPVAWRSANIYALYKGKGAQPSSPDSYRPISLTSVVVKVVERLVLSRVRAVFTPSPFQAGFRAKHSCSDQLHRLNALLHSSHRHASRSYRSVVFIDFQKAFDKVWHKVLLWKLHVAGVRGRTLRWIAAFLSDRRIRIAHRSAYSDWFPITAGAPQGAILSPELFLVFINDLPDCLPRSPSTRLPVCHIFLLADDVALSGGAGGKLGDQQLNLALAAVGVWMETNLMRASHSKTQVLCCHRQRIRDPSSIRPALPIALPPLGVLSLATSYCYLGVVYEQKIGRTTAHFTKVLEKARRSASLAYRIVAAASSSSPIRVVRQLVSMMVAPSFTYGWPHWRPTKQQFARFDSVLVAPLRRALHLPTTSATASVLLECGVLPARALFARATLSYARRAALLPAVHPTAVLHARPPARFPLLSAIDDAELDLGISHRRCTRGEVRRASLVHSLRLWRQQSSCSGLRLFRSPLPASARDTAAPYIRLDPLAHLRARLRLNRSSLNDSQHRRGIIADPACRCGHARETPGHLLYCPLFAPAAAAFLNHPLVAGRATLLLHDSLHLRPADRATVIALGSTFLAHVHAHRPGGI
jgi:endonuclease/exonuclease/phosphatase family metal-dependent hydrolase